MTPQEQNKTLTEQLVANLRRTSRYPKGLFPHLVFVEEVDDHGDPCFIPYRLESICRETGDCTLVNDRTGEKTVYHLREINIDWLITVWNRCTELSIEQGLWKDRAVEVLQEHTEAAEMDIREFVDEHWQNLLLDEENIAAFKDATTPRKNPLEYPLRRLLDVASLEISCFEQSDTFDICASAIDALKYVQADPPKQLWAFAWPIELMYDDVTDRQILDIYHNGPSRSLIDEEDEDLHTVERMTPKEFTDRINANDCPFGQQYTRLIYTNR